MADIDFHRMNELKNLIGKNQATDGQKKEYMKMLLDNGNIKKEQYESFIKNENSDDILKAGLAIK